ncbi:hypothetical protein GGF43_000086 [Coemansia sp. RSA 2618]|nr:hypothetical protein GGF43_000086 [Coemansia sp. RSA 2618]
MSAMVRLRSGPKRQADISDTTTQAISSGAKKARTKTAKKDGAKKPVLRARRGEAKVQSGDASEQKAASAKSDKAAKPDKTSSTKPDKTSSAKPDKTLSAKPGKARANPEQPQDTKQRRTANTTHDASAKLPPRKRKLAETDAEPQPGVNFIMSSPKRKPREALGRIGAANNNNNAQADSSKRRKQPDNDASGFHSPQARRVNGPGDRNHAPGDRTPERASGTSTPTLEKGAASPLKTMLLAPMNSLWRRMSGLVQGAAAADESDSSSTGSRPPALRVGNESHDTASMPGSFTRGSSLATDEAGAPVGSLAANSLTAPPMNPTGLGAGVQLYLPDGDSCSASPVTMGYPETPSKENIPMYSESAFTIDLDGQETGVTTITPLALPGLSDDQMLGDLNTDSDLDLSHVSSLADSELDAQYDPYFAYDEEEEFDPYLFMSNLPPIPREHKLRPYALPRKTRSTPPITLVLDLDETLVHCALTKVDNADMVFPVEYNGINYDVYCRLRPGYREFLERASALFEVVVFTASQQVYADRLLNLIDPERRYIRHRLFRDSCVYVNTNYVKDLGILGRDEARMMLVDNCPQAFAYQQSNGIPIESWYEDKADRELMRLMEFLEKLVGVDDVRPLIDAEFKTKEKITDAERRYLSRRASGGPQWVRAVRD